MRKLKIVWALVPLFALLGVACYLYDLMVDTVRDQLLITNVESLTSNESSFGDAYIECRCTATIGLTPNGCYADGKSDYVCRGSVNAKCWEYHNNCSK